MSRIAENSGISAKEEIRWVPIEPRYDPGIDAAQNSWEEGSISANENSSPAQIS